VFRKLNALALFLVPLLPRPHADVFNNRGIARGAKGDIKGALQDYNEAIRLGYNPLQRERRHPTGSFRATSSKP